MGPKRQVNALANHTTQTQIHWLARKQDSLGTTSHYWRPLQIPHFLFLQLLGMLIRTFCISRYRHMCMYRNRLPPLHFHPQLGSNAGIVVPLPAACRWLHNCTVPQGMYSSKLRWTTASSPGAEGEDRCLYPRVVYNGLIWLKSMFSLDITCPLEEITSICGLA